ncbi:hypothetical protein DFH29DRAFT_1040493 [Suillus ampliporus]|nr:hypothetical protein DFH29DRAFT_1040493 [Suillus ampliporus]
MTGRPPYVDARSDHQVTVLILKGKKPTSPSSPPVADSFWGFIEKCWSDAGNRPSAVEVLSILDQIMSADTTRFALLSWGKEGQLRGTTACVVAGRLAACDSSLKILILEGGRHTLNQDTHVQSYLYAAHQAPTSTTVTPYVANPSPSLNGRAPIVSAGRCVGGGSSVSFMVYTRAPASDYDDWGVDGWESKNLIPLMKKLETYEEQPVGLTHRHDGPIKVSYGGRKPGVWEEFIQVGTTYHKGPYADDMDDLETCNTYSSDAAHHYIYNQAHNPNLQLWVGKHVKRVVLDIVRASKLVVVSAGAFGSPAILERSGIGAKGVLEHCGIEQLLNLPGVGENYRDHNGGFTPFFASDEAVTLDPLWRGDGNVMQESLAQWKINGKSFITENGCDAKIKWRDEDELRAMGSAFQPTWKEFFQDRPEKAVSILAPCAGYVALSSAFPHRNYLGAGYFTVLTLYPKSVGSVHIKLEENGREGIDFTTGFLDDSSDIVPLNFAYKRLHELIRRMPSYRGEVPAGHPHFPEGSAAICGKASGPVALNAPDIIYTAEDDEVVDKFHRDTMQTSWHSLGTCAMKPESDQGVGDARLNVYGVANLKVADMSIAPKNRRPINK